MIAVDDCRRHWSDNDDDADDGDDAEDHGRLQRPADVSVRAGKRQSVAAIGLPNGSQA